MEQNVLFVFLSCLINVCPTIQGTKEGTQETNNGDSSNDVG